MINIDTEKKEIAYYFSWVRKGLGNRISETDTLAEANAHASATQRPLLLVTAEYELTPAAIDEDESADTIPMSEMKAIEFVSPGDILSLSTEAILRAAPKEDSAGFPTSFYPYVEFWEADFPWRYTPARPMGNKLRPWLALLVCPQPLCSIKIQNGRPYATLLIENDAQYGAIFPLPKDTWKSAHAQGSTPNTPEFSRLISLRLAEKLEEQTDYCALLVPAFETGRLRGLGYDEQVLKDIAAQAPAWEASLQNQKNLHPQQALDFPVYYSWKFKTGTDSFDELAKKLSIAGGFEPGIAVDVTRMGEGLDHAVLGQNAPSRKILCMPAATEPPGTRTAPPFPATNTDEAETHRRLADLLSKSPVFLENQQERSGSAKPVPAGADDPWVVPPIYGGKHVLATFLDEAVCRQEGTPWLRQLNLDIHHRAAAGLGKRTVQVHQEEFVNRAWKQVEAVQALNRELHQRLLSVNVNESLKGKTVNSFQTEKHFIERMLQYLGSMKDAKTDKGTSLASILKDSHIPQAFASATFHQLTDKLSQMVQSLDTSSVMENIANKHIFRMKAHAFYNLPTKGQLREALDAIYAILYKEICDRLEKYFYVVRGNSSNIKTLYTLQPKRIASDFDELMTSDFYEILNKEYGINISPPSYGPELVAKENYLYYGYRLDNRPQLRYVYYEVFPGLYEDKYTPIQKVMPLETPCVLVLDDGEYQSLFGAGDKLVTQIGAGDGLEQLRCFIAKSKMPALLALTDKEERAAYFQVAISYEARQIFSGNSSSPLRKGETVAEAHYNCETGELSNDWEYSGTYSYLGKTREDRYFMVVDLKVVEKLGHLQKFPAIADYAEFLKTHPPHSANKYLNEWIQLDSCLEKLPSAKVDETPPSAINTKNVEELQEAFEDNAAYEKMREVLEEYYCEYCERMEAVAEVYYGAFFDDTPQGKQLREKYIDELLASKYPILAYPIFPEPAYYYLKMFSDKFIIPCVDELPEDSVAVFQSNPPFVEAYLCGMNTEMGRELLWREYPTDQRGSYFRKFWDSETSVDDIHNDNFFDIKPIHTWKGNLGDSHPESKKGLLLFAIKGKLMRQYPSTQVFLQKARSVQELEMDLDPWATEENSGILRPVIQAFLREDILLVGFNRGFEQLVGNPRRQDFGYFLVFQEDVEDLNFQSPEQGAPKASADNAAQVAQALKNKPTLYGKHLSLFIP